MIIISSLCLNCFFLITLSVPCYSFISSLSFLHHVFMLPLFSSFSFYDFFSIHASAVYYSFMYSSFLLLYFYYSHIISFIINDIFLYCSFINYRIFILLLIVFISFIIHLWILSYCFIYALILFTYVPLFFLFPF